MVLPLPILMAEVKVCLTTTTLPGTPLLHTALSNIEQSQGDRERNRHRHIEEERERDSLQQIVFV